MGEAAIARNARTDIKLVLQKKKESVERLRESWLVTHDRLSFYYNSGTLAKLLIIQLDHDASIDQGGKSISPKVCPGVWHRMTRQPKDVCGKATSVTASWGGKGKGKPENEDIRTRG